MGLAFINYRREDAGAASQGIYAQMNEVVWLSWTAPIVNL
jgi:hypothetical protein